MNISCSGIPTGENQSVTMRAGRKPWLGRDTALNDMSLCAWTRGGSNRIFKQR